LPFMFTITSPLLTTPGTALRGRNKQKIRES
jgi:hypothetical protein